ncbi:head-tail connector protein [Chitinophaga sp. Hz27]|uniref:head-tail connector protein n=1 Tax=Chitinophaga sp. Hz27 TaxID=3347169 RepID=UPI0035DAF136
MIYSNKLIDYAFENAADIVEPVTLAEAKSYMRIDDDVTADDNLILNLITAAREDTEKYTGCSIIERTVKAILEIHSRHELPYGPVKDKPTVPGAVVTGFDFPWLEGYGVFTVSYPVGYGDKLPAELKMAILAKIASMYENRGDEDRKHDSEIYYELASKYRRVTCW